MKVTIHTPRVYEEDWEIPAAEPGMTDAEILAMTKGWEPGVLARRRGHRTIDTGSAFVYARGVTDVEAEGRKLAEKRAAAERELRDFVDRACEGGASERRVAAALGVDRNTVRAWRGKARADR